MSGHKELRAEAMSMTATLHVLRNIIYPKYALKPERHDMLAVLHKSQGASRILVARNLYLFYFQGLSVFFREELLTFQRRYTYFAREDILTLPMKYIFSEKGLYKG